MTESTGIAIVITSAALQSVTVTETGTVRGATVDQTRCSIAAITIARPKETTVDPFHVLALPRKNKFEEAGLASAPTTGTGTSEKTGTTVTTETTERREITETLGTTETETKERREAAREIAPAKMVEQKVAKTQ